VSGPRHGLLPAIDGLDSDFILHVRTPQRPEAMIAPVRAILRSLDPEMPIVEVRTLREEVEASLWQERLLAWLFDHLRRHRRVAGKHRSLRYARLCREVPHA